MQGTMNAMCRQETGNVQYPQYSQVVLSWMNHLHIASGKEANHKLVVDLRNGSHSLHTMVVISVPQQEVLLVQMRSGKTDNMSETSNCCIGRWRRLFFHNMVVDDLSRWASRSLYRTELWCLRGD